MAKRKLKKITLHPITSFVLLIVGVILLSFILSLFNVSATYSNINIATGALEKTLVSVNNLLSYIILIGYCLCHICCKCIC